MMTAEQVLGDAGRLPTISSVASELAKIVRDPDASAQHVEAIVRKDPTLAAELLRIANSASFYVPREVKSIRQAVVLIGTKRLFDLATTAAFARALPPLLAGYGVSAASFFCHCAAVAIIAERLAAHLGVGARDMLFVQGLLHDIGKLALGRFIEENKAALREELVHVGRDIVKSEKAVLGTDHAEVGALLAQRWNLPIEVELCSRHHHEPALAPPEGVDLVAVVHAADALSHMLGYGSDFGGLARRVDVEVTKRLGITVKELESVAAETLDPILELSRTFGAPRERTA